ncbi:hypothetical protein KGF56_000745 [Candida oxycetoniae]|uniref:Alpha-1,2-mannosyltransferase n=1 Tax=Candida oxycetoniae TaxID=497107 RepID=A0AAI9T0Y8_9ASCO|nr:uncharacterized protein KGF56_000745 [Candida oxycetoniae]KAI3406612.2 hypothetical protein KGF56_000745 [Candida oxycetoniae]
MFLPRLSLSYLLLGFLVVAIIIFNVTILSTPDESSITYNKSKGATYHTGGTSKMNAQIDKIDSPEYVAAVMKELQETKFEEILGDLKKQISKEQRPKIIQQLKTELRQKYSEIIKQTLKDEIKEENTVDFYKQDAFSFQLYQNLISQFQHDHGNQIKPMALLTLLKDHFDNDFVIPSDFKEEVEKIFVKYFDKKSFFQYLLKTILLENKPQCDPLTAQEKGKKLNPTYQWDARVISEKDLLASNLKLSPEKLKCLQKSHDKVVEKLKSLPDPPNQFISGYGIVINGGGGMIVSALTAITNLRDRGSTLPVELILDTPEEFDKQICQDLLPNKLNGKCVVVSDVIGKEVFDLIPEKFSRKILGILVSSFDHTIALDADNFPIQNVDGLLYTEPYLSTKMILWPDLWVKLTSPLFYKIARIEKGEVVGRFGISNEAKFHEYIQKDRESEIHFHDFSNLPSPISVETGQMVFSKREHLKSLLLALYYNINLKGWYQDLIYQGAYGEGDRETIAPALHVMNERYHLMNQKIHLMGYTAENDKFSETTLGQTDPRDNPQFYADWQKFLSKKNIDTRLNPFQSGGFTNDLIDQFKEYKKKIIEDKKIEEEDTTHRVVEYKLPKILFLHCNHPKIDPIKNSQEGEFGVYSRRNMGPVDKVKPILDKDWELKFHSIAKWVACEAITSTDYWSNAKVDQKTVCQKLSKYIDFLKRDTFGVEAEFKGFGSTGLSQGVIPGDTTEQLANDKINALAQQQAKEQAEAEAKALAEMDPDGKAKLQAAKDNKGTGKEKDSEQMAKDKGKGVAQQKRTKGQ